MLKIKQIQIKNFRSIVNSTIISDNMNVFVGLNDAGKSNVLKALNLFFNGETEPDVAFDFGNDYSKYAPIRKNKAKEISIAITFSIPSNFKDSDDVVWKKVWRYYGIYSDNFKDLNFSPYSKVPTLIKRVKYKYVPAVKSNDYFKLLLSDLYNSIAQEIDGELNEKAKEYSISLKLFTHRISEIVEKNIGIKSGLTMPANQSRIFKELIFVTNDEKGNNIDLSYRGDGIKAMHIPAILKYISEHDNQALGMNTVPYTHIWGYEEPENGVELKKCFELSKELYNYSVSIQQFVTTHSPGFYGLEEKNNVKVYYSYKDTAGHYSVFDDNKKCKELHNIIGIMPLVTPFIIEKQNEIDRLKETLSVCNLSDINTVFVEGITDKEYLELAIKYLSPKLKEQLDSKKLIIKTREENGCGTDLLCDWAVAWMHMNYQSSAIFLFDCDKAGKTAKEKFNDNKKNYSQKSKNVFFGFLQPTEDIKKLNHKINNSLLYEIEHLLSYDFWETIKRNGWASLKSNKELISTFSEKMTKEKSANDVIEEVIENEKMKDTIVLWNPKDSKKNQILNSVKLAINDGELDVIIGFENTIKFIEQKLKL